MRRLKLITFEGCPNAEPARALLVAAGADFEEVRQEESAAAFGYSSPTLLDGGRVIFGARLSGFARGCSLGLPSAERLAELLRESRLEMLLERVDPAAEALVQEVLEAAPNYTRKTEGADPRPGDGRDTLEALPPGCAAGQKEVLLLWREGVAIGVADLIRGYPDPDTAFVGLMLLREDSQRRGLGARFYRLLEARIREWGCGRVRLATVDANPVVPFWEKMGFKLTGETRLHEGAHVRSLKRVMVKKLQP